MAENQDIHIDLKQYVGGKRHGKPANQLERKAMNDPFLQDAIDGFDAVEGNHGTAISNLEKRISSAKKRKKRVWWWAAAAVLLLLVGIPYLLYQPEQEIPMVLETPKEAPTPKTESEELILHPDIIPETENTEDAIVITEENKTREKIIPPSEKSQMDITEHEENSEIILETPQAKMVRTDEQAVAVESATLTIGPKSKVVSGQLVDELGFPLPGATLVIKNTTTGVQTDFDGNFELTIPEGDNDVLVVSYLGYETKEVPLQSNLEKIVLEPNDMALDEVVVTGYASRKKRAISHKNENITVFGEDEFTTYIEENYDKSICSEKPIRFTVKFRINSEGKPEDILIKKVSCPEFSKEIERLLLSSPQWSTTERQFTLKIELQ